MTIASILQELDAQIVLLQQAKALLSNEQNPKMGVSQSRPLAGQARVRKKRALSPEARQRIAEAQRRRWAAARKRSAK